MACLSRSGDHWPSLVFVWTRLHSVLTAMTLGQFPQYGPCARSVRGYFSCHVHLRMYIKCNNLLRTLRITRQSLIRVFIAPGLKKGVFVHITGW